MDDTFTTFLESLRTDENRVLIDTVIEGYEVLTESFNLTRYARGDESLRQSLLRLERSRESVYGILIDVVAILGDEVNNIFRSVASHLHNYTFTPQIADDIDTTLNDILKKTDSYPQFDSDMRDRLNEQVTRCIQDLHTVADILHRDNYRYN